MKSYKVFDHLGSLRVEGIGVGNDIQSYYDYKPFGGLEFSGTNQPFNKAKTRLGYVDMPKDKESNLGDHGVRKYDSEVGRFLAVDPLWEKYHTLNPFQYSANSPVMQLDVNGFETWVKNIGDGKFEITGGEVNDDKSIYLVDKNEKKTNSIIGRTLTPYSFVYGDSKTFAVGSIINTRDNSGINFINNEIMDLVNQSNGLDFGLYNYMSNALCSDCVYNGSP